MLMAGLLGAVAWAQPVSGYADLHIHLAAHLAVPVYGSGPDRAPPAEQDHLHGLEPQLFVEQLAAPGPSVLVSLAYANPFFTAFETRRSMWARLERQLDYVEAFCAKHSDRFGFARSPAEARAIVASGRKAVVHGIEGGTLVLQEGDARAWAERGVAVITPVHLADNGMGGAWCQEGALFALNVWGCFAEALNPAHHGLTRAGAEKVDALIAAGIVVDLAHASDATFADIVPRLRAAQVAPVYTHATPHAVRADSVALTDAELRTVHELGGLVALTANRDHLRPRPLPSLPEAHCANSIDDFRLQWDHLTRLLPGEPIAWGSDFQGGVDHLGPKYGPQGCGEGPAGRELTEFDTAGLAHAGLVEPMFASLAAAGSDREPLDRSAERFLQVWERALAAATR